MNTKNDNYFIFRELLMMTVFVIVFAACSEMDDYKDYVDGGEITYPGIIDSVKAHPGHNRLLLTGLLSSDPKITGVKVYWNSNKDSVVQNITRSTGIDTVRFLLENMAENVYSFTFYTFDAQGNLSVPVSKTGEVYGDKYLASLNNRLIESAELTDTGTVIVWGEAGYLDGLISTEVVYMKENGDQGIAYQKTSDAESAMVLKDYHSGTKFSYRSLFMPDSMCIDTFYTDFDEQGVLENVTSQYLKNADAPIQYSEWDGSRWGIPADWTTNDAVRNANGYGGFEMKSGVGFFSMEAGWGLPAVENGKIYQTITLPAGNYSFEIDLGENGSAGTKYIVAAEGDELPDFEYVADQSLGYAGVTSGKISFELPEQTVVSLGFVCDLPGNGEYCKIGAVRLFSHP